MITPDMPQWFREAVDRASTQQETRQAIAEALWEDLLSRGRITEDPFFFRLVFHLMIGKTPDGWWDDVDVDQDVRRGYVRPYITG